MKTVVCDNYENLLGPLPPSDEPCESQKQDREYQKSSRGNANILENLTPLKVQRGKNVLSSFFGESRRNIDCKENVWAYGLFQKSLFWRE